MKSTLGIAIILAATAAASASVRVFVTTSSDGYGLTNPANHDVPTFSTVDALGVNLNAYDYAYYHFVVAAFPPINAPSGTEADPVEILPHDWAYIWIQFQYEPKSVHINGLKIEITGPGGFIPTYYVQNDKGGVPSKKRWDGTATAPNYPEWHNNPQTLVAITANGINNGGSDPQMMYKTQSGTHPRTGVALLGAIDGIVPGTYGVNITQIGYATPPNPIVAGGVFHMVPEPASALLLGLVSLLIRRR